MHCKLVNIIGRWKTAVVHCFVSWRRDSVGSFTSLIPSFCWLIDWFGFSPPVLPAERGFLLWIYVLFLLEPLHSSFHLQSRHSPGASCRQTLFPSSTPLSIFNRRTQPPPRLDPLNIHRHGGAFEFSSPPPHHRFIHRLPTLDHRARPRISFRTEKECSTIMWE